jgi:hypothetical protein
MPIPNYLQAQEVADRFGAMIDIRATAAGAPELLAQGLAPKSDNFKQKTMNKDDELLGLPPEHRDRMVWFLPSRPKPEHFKDYPEDVLRRVWARWKQRKDEYYDNLAKMKKKLREGQIAVRPVGGTSSGGVVEQNVKGIDGLLKGVAFTGDHDIFQVHGNAGAVVNALKAAPFRVQHGAHMDWPATVREAEHRELTPVEQDIFDAIVRKHLAGGESLLRINPHGPPTTANSGKLTFATAGGGGASGGGGGGGGPDLEVVEAKEPGGGAAAAGESAKAAAMPAQEKFTALGKAHTVTMKTLEPGEPDIVIASLVPSSPAATVRRTVTAAERALLDINELSASTNGILDKSKRLKEMARQASVRSGVYPPEVMAALADLAQIVAACWEKIGYDGERIDQTRVLRGQPGRVGDVGEHREGGQGRRTDPSAPPPMRQLTKLESEHVLPWSWIDAIFSKLYRVGSLPTQKESSVYPRMTTVMTYKGAATGKTSTAVQNSDMEVLRWLRGVSPREARITLRDNLPALIQHRLQIILNETARYVQTVKRDHNIDLPMQPDTTKISSALAAQLAQVFSAARELG